MLKIKYVVLVFLFAIISTSKAQVNSLKAIVWGIGEPVYTIGIWQMGLSYERKIALQHSIVLDGNYLNSKGTGLPIDGTYQSYRYNTSLSYRYYFSSEKKFLSNFWLSSGMKYQNYQYESNNRESINKKSDFYGIKIMAGKQFNSKKSNWSVDFGIGVSYGVRVYTYYYYKYWNEEYEPIVDTNLPANKLVFLPDFILRIGLSF